MVKKELEGEPRLKVIGAGWGRTGTNSVKIALEKLLDGPCYHMRLGIKTGRTVWMHWANCFWGNSVKLTGHHGLGDQVEFLRAPK